MVDPCCIDAVLARISEAATHMKQGALTHATLNSTTSPLHSLTSWSFVSERSRFKLVRHTMNAYSSSARVS